MTTTERDITTMEEVRAATKKGGAFFIRPGYTARAVPEYFHDNVADTRGITYQTRRLPLRRASRCLLQLSPHHRHRLRAGAQTRGTAPAL
ncbi:MAG TPA: hypothetical protein VF656_06035 [Pyrinomonadaceae bacterium]|jgi:hypothetical protein